MARRWEPADTVTAGAVALLIVVFAIFGFLVWQGFGTTLSQAETRAQNGAAVIADEAQWVVSAGSALLTQEALDVAGDLKNITPADQAAFTQAAKALPAETAVGFYGADGNALPMSGAEPLPPSIATKDYFLALKTGADLELSAQEKDATTGDAIFLIAKRLDNGGTFGGAAVMAINENLLQAFWSRLDLGPQSTVSLVRDDGWLIARYPALAQPLNLNGLPVFTAITKSSEGTYTSESSPVDGVARVVAFRHVPGLSFIALASVSRDAVLAGLWTSVWTVLLLMGPIGIGLLIGALLAARLLRQGERTRRTLAAAVAHNEVLFREIHHRVKNNLQSVASLLQLQPIPREVKTEMGLRISAMSAVHEHIYRSNSFATVEVRDYLHTLIENIRAGADPGVNVIEEIENLPVDKDHATPLGLIVNEVVANAFKHAFSDGRQGVVTIKLVREDDKLGRLQVEDNGVGFDPATPTKGIGRRLIAALTEQLGGQSSFSSAAAGSRFVLTFPLAG